jgi:NAD(P)-dependent dehydrogenase (short-subunit alcohol dehydrogenase family)
MQLDGTVAVITGGARGIGAALATRFLSEGAAGVTIVDVLADDVAATAERLGPRAHGIVADVTDQDAVEAAVADTEERFGPVDLFCANAGIATGTDIDGADELWDRAWRVNVFAHVVAARVMIPRWVERGGGRLLVTASAAGLLTNLGDAAYSATKHAAVGFAEWVSITYGDRGVQVSCLCPQGVRTDMLLGAADGELAAEVVLAQGAIEPEEVAAAVVEGLADERFLILPHPEVADYYRNRATDTDRWLAGMRRLQARIVGAHARPDDG